MAIQTLQIALDRNPVKGKIILHSDQGSQYTSRAFTEFCEGKGIRQSMSKAGCPYDNSPMESFYGTFKSEFIRQNRFETDQELNESTLDYVYGYYNHIRPHSSNGYMTPFEKRYSNQWFFSVWMLQKCLTISKPTPRFTVVVVLDTPPFWLHMAITLHIILTLRILQIH